MPVIQTVLGDISPAQLGATLCHEHLLIDLKRIFQEPQNPADRVLALEPVTIENLGWVRTNYSRSLDNLGLYDEQTSTEEASLFANLGGSAIVEVTPVDVGRCPEALVRISRATGLHVIMGCGYYVSATHPDTIASRSEESICEEMAGEIREGVDATGIRSGIIGEIGCTWPLADDERKVLRAAARAQVETGAAITIHPGRDPLAPHEILEVVEGAGGDAGRTVVGHLDRTYHSFSALLDLARRGCYLEFDMFGLESAYYPMGSADMPNDGRRIDLIMRLIDAGFLESIVISHDIAFKHTLVRYGGLGYGHILTNVVPKMRSKGMSEGEISRILIENPRKMLSIA